MAATQPAPDVMTPEQAADYLQLSRDTIYRYIRDGKLVAGRFGRQYRIPRQYLDLLLLEQASRSDITLREFSDEQIDTFLAEDVLNSAARGLVERAIILSLEHGDHVSSRAER